MKRKEAVGMEQIETGREEGDVTLVVVAWRLKRSIEAKVALPRPFRHVLESNQNQIINRDVARADLPSGVFVRVHRGPGLLLKNKCQVTASRGNNFEKLPL